MRLLVGVALTLLCVGLDALHHQSPFKAGKRYEYDYYGHFIAGIPDVGILQNGFSLKSQVEIQVPEQGKLIVQFHDFKTATLEKQLRHVDEKVIPWVYQPVSGLLKEQLESPILVNYNDGKVTSFVAQKRDSPDAINIKKGLLSLLNVDTSQHSNPNPDEYMRQRSRSNEAGTNNEVVTYTILEDGIGGNCETHYSLETNPWPGNPNAEVYNVTKIKNYRNCVERPLWVRTSHLAVKCADCSADKQHPLGTTAVIEYDILAEDEELVIEEIRSEGQSIFAPLSPDSNTMFANHSQILTLLQSDSNAQNVPIPEPETHTTLQYKFPTSEWAKKQPASTITKRPLTPFLTLEKENPLEQAKQVLNELVSDIKSTQYDEDTPHKLSKLVGLLRKLNFDEVKEFYLHATREKMLNSDSQKVAISALAMTGSNPAILYIKYLIEARQINGEQALTAVQGIAKNMLEPTYEIVSQIMALAKSQAVKEQHQLQQTAWLTVGILINQACDGEQDDVPTLPLPPFMDTPYCSNQVEKQYLEELNLHLREPPFNREHLLLFIRVLGLTELPRAAEYLKQYAQGDALSINDEVVQVAALQALKEIAKNAPEKVKEIAEKEFYDSDNDNSVRIAAIRAVMASKPDLSDMERLAIYSANNEESDDVAGYVYSLFDTLANSTHYCNQEVAKNAQQLLSLLDEEADNGILGSSFYESSQIFEELGMSTSTYVSWTSSNSSVLPQTLNIRINNTVAGYSHVPLQINVQAKGIQTIIDRIIGPQANLLNIKSLEDIFKPESQQPDQHRSEINAKLNLKTRKEDSFFVSAFIKSEREARQVYVDYKRFTDSVQAVLRSGMSLSDLEKGIPIHYHHLSISHEIKSQVPTLLGLPLVVAVNDPTIFSVKGMIFARYEPNSEVEPLIFPPIPKPARVQIESNLKISYSSRPSITFGLYNPFKVTVSAVILATPTFVALPLNVKVALDILKGKVSLTVKPQESAYQKQGNAPTVLHYKVKPMTIQFSAKLAPIQEGPKIIHAQPPKRFEVDLSQKALGLPLILRASSEQDWTDYAALKDKFDDYESTASLLNTYWATPDFSYRNIEVVLSGDSAQGKEVYIALEYSYVPTQSEILVLASKSSAKGFWTVLSGFARLPEKCIQNEEITDPYEFSYSKGWQNQRSRSQRQQGQSWLTGYRVAKSSQYQQDAPAHHVHQAQHISHEHQRDEPQSESRAPFVVEMQPRREQISILKMKLIAIAKSETEAKLVDANLVIVRNDDTATDAVNARVVLANPLLNTPQELVVCTRGTIKYPILPCDFERRMDPKNIGEIKAEFRVDLGECGQTNKFISIMAKAQKSKEQEDMERQKSQWYFQQCQEDLNNEQKLSYACDLAAEEISSLNKIVVLVKHSGVPNWLKNATSKVDNYLKQAMYKQMSNNPIDVNNPIDELKIKLVFHDEVPALDLSIKKPTEETEFRKVYFQKTLPYLQSPNADTSLLESVIDDLTDDSYSPSCAVMNKNVNTFDNETYEFEFTPCYHVVAKDCSPSDLFAVSLAKLNNKQKKLKINLLQHTILVEPKEGSRNQYKVEVDGREVQPTDDQYVVLNGITDDGKMKILGHVVKDGHKLVIQAPLHGVQVSFDGQDTLVEVSNLWRGQLCGMCGEFRDETQVALQGPDQCQYPTADAFGLSYAIKHFTCTVRQPDNKEKLCDSQSKSIDPFYDGSSNTGNLEYKDEESSRDPQELRISPTQPGFSCYVKRNQIIDKFGSRCFSLLPQTECSHQCQTTRTEDVFVDFHCLPEDDTMSQILTTGRDTKILHVLARKRADLTQRITVATECRPFIERKYQSLA